MKFTLLEKKEETQDVISFSFEPEKPVSWRAGQFMHYKLPHPKPDDRGEERYFTISSAPDEGKIMLSTRFSKTPSTFKIALYRLPVGGTLEADGPDGDFTIENRENPQVFIAGGMGITPYRSILMDLDRRKQPMDINLFYANRTDDFVFKEELDGLARKHPEFKIHYFITPERITNEEIAKAAHAVNDQEAVFYISGPEPMVDIFRKIFGGMGVMDFRIKRDYFPGYIWP